MSRSLSWVAIGLLTACGNGGDGDGKTTGNGPPANPSDGSPPTITVRPGDIDFGHVDPGLVQEQFITVINDGGSPLVVSEVVLEGGAFAFLEQDADGQFELAPGDLKYVEVLYTPTEREDLGSMTFKSNDPQTPEVTVAFAGVALLGELVLTPVEHDFGDVPIPCADEVTVMMHNTGNAPVTITEISYESGDLFELAEQDSQWDFCL